MQELEIHLGLEFLAKCNEDLIFYLSESLISSTINK
jgi:hypothetical protein